MATHTSQWESLGAFLQHIARSGTKKLSKNRSQTADPFFGEADLQTFVQQCQTLTRHDFAARCRDIDAVAASLVGDIGGGVSIRRRQTWGPSGASVNVHRVLRGNLGRAWRLTERTPVLADGGALVLLLPSTISGTVEHDQIIWSAVATLAVADYARRQGRRVELWSIGYSSAAYDNGDHHILTVPLVRAGEVWDPSAVVMATYPEWPRRLGFRDREICAHRDHRPLRKGYGAVLDPDSLLAWARSTWAPRQGLPGEAIRLGCTQYANVYDRRSAERWATEQLAQLAA